MEVKHSLPETPGGSGVAGWLPSADASLEPLYTIRLSSLAVNRQSTMPLDDAEERNSRRKANGGDGLESGSRNSHPWRMEFKNSKSRSSIFQDACTKPIQPGLQNHYHHHQYWRVSSALASKLFPFQTSRYHGVGMLDSANFDGQKVASRRKSDRSSRTHISYSFHFVLTAMLQSMAIAFLLSLQFSPNVPHYDFPFVYLDFPS